MTQSVRKLKGILFSRVVIIAALIVFQLAVLLVFILRLSRYFVALYGVFILLSVVVAFYLVNKEDNPSYKLAWIIPIMLFPLFGGLFYLLFGNMHRSSKTHRKMKEIREKAITLLDREPPFSKQLAQIDPMLRNQSAYLTRMGYPVYTNTETLYHSPGESKFKAMCEAMEKAEHYIFMEYFIIEEGVMWNTILEILERKVQQGVEVRVMYDGFGCMMTLPEGYYKRLREKGIQCVEFNPLIPVMSIVMNNRDHRKILAIDGTIGFMGGINLADEYINAIVKHGHWKDCAVELRGDAVWSLVVMFLTMWEGVTGSPEDPTKYRADPSRCTPVDNGFVQPYSDSPLDGELVGEMVYLNIINHAKNYLYICTPYLIIDNETVTALILAAKSGVDVRIMTPHIGDKWFVHMTTHAYYRELLRGGVKIYEYTPGFVHSKSFVADDEVATIGTINLDYRSLYLHFECGVWMCHTAAIPALKADYLATLEKCMPITPESPMVRVGLLQEMARAVLRLFAPLM